MELHGKYMAFVNLQSEAISLVLTRRAHGIDRQQPPAMVKRRCTLDAMPSWRSHLLGARHGCR
jgi:hypothetical protein